MKWNLSKQNVHLKMHAIYEKKVVPFAHLVCSGLFLIPTIAQIGEDQINWHKLCHLGIGTGAKDGLD